MAPVAPSKCGVEGCPGDATRSALTCKCDVAAHHKAYLVQDSSGTVTWAWTPRGPSALTKAGFTILKSEPGDARPGAVEPAPRAAVADEVALQVAAPEHEDPQTPSRPSAPGRLWDSVSARCMAA